MYPINIDTLRLFQNDQKQTIDITFKDGTKLTGANVLEGGMAFDRCCVSGKNIEIGAATVSELTLKLNNADGQFDDTVFEGKEFFARIGIKDWADPLSEMRYIPIGYYTVDETPRKLATLSLSALDRMIRFDTAYHSTLTYPATVKQILLDACTHCDITLATDPDGLTNYDYVVTAKPEVENTTWRHILQWLGEITGTCAYMDWDGKLRMEWYTRSGITIAPEDRFKSNTDEKTVSLSGVKIVVPDSEDDSTDKETYAFEIENNPLVQADFVEIFRSLSEKLDGLTYLPYDCTTISYPFLYPLDVITYIDKNGVPRNSLITNVTHKVNGTSTLAAVGETATKRQYSKTDPMTKQQIAMIEADFVRTKVLTAEIANVNKLFAGEISAIKGKIDQLATVDLEAINANITNLTAAIGRIDVAILNFATVEQLNTVNALIGTANINIANINLALIDKASIAQLDAIKVVADTATIAVAEIKTLLSGSVSAGSTQTIVLNAQNATIDIAFIKSGIAAHMQIGDVMAGTISTNRFSVASDSGKFLINDNTLQIADDNHMRVQLGKDASGDYSLYVWDKTGKLMFDALGLTAEGIQNPIIRNDMIANNANIDGSKLNISSVVSGINNGTTTINSSVLQFDPTGQSFNVVFQELSSSVKNIEIGGRNLLKKSDVHYENASYPTAVYDFGNEKLAEGETCTIQIKGQLGEGKSFFGIYNSSGNVCPTSLYPSDQKNGIYTKTFKWVVGGTPNTKLYFFPIPNTVTTTSTIEWIKLERGNKATDWTPAPEDIVEVVTAQSTALTVANGKITALITESTQTKTSVAELTDKISIDQQTKLNGVELLSQDYRTDPSSKALTAERPSSASIVPTEKPKEYQYKLIGAARLMSDFIPFNPQNPFYTSVDVFYKDTTGSDKDFFVGVEFYDAKKVSMGSNDLVMYSINVAPNVDVWTTYEGFVNIHKISLENLIFGAKYVRLRILSRWLDKQSKDVSYIKNIHFKQLGANQATEITVLNDKYNSTTTTVSGMQSVIGEHTTKIDTQTGQITDVTSKANALERDLTGTKSTLTETTKTANAASTKVSEVSQKLDSFGITLSNTKAYTDKLEVERVQQSGFQFKLDVVVHGDIDKYYPVVIKGGDQYTARRIVVKRALGWQAPPEWNPSLPTHHGSLNVALKCNFGAWGGVPYEWQIDGLQEQYCKMFAGAASCGSGIGFAVFLRGGGEIGALYQFLSDQSLTTNIYQNAPDGVLPAPQICYNSDLIFYPSTTYQFYAPPPRVYNDAVIKEIKLKSYVAAASESVTKIEVLTTQQTQFTADLSGITGRVTSVETKTTATDKTVTTHTTEISALKTQILLKVEQSDIDTAVSAYTKTADLSAWISIHKDVIVSAVSATYATKNELTGYSNTTQMNSAINQKAGEITQSVSATYATKTSVDGKADQSTVTALSSLITTQADKWTASFSIIGTDGYVRSGKTEINASGLTIYDGALTVKNKVGLDVLKADAVGNLNMVGNFTQYAENGNKALEMKDNRIWMRCWEDDGATVGSITSGVVYSQNESGGHSEGLLIIGNESVTLGIENDSSGTPIFEGHIKIGAFDGITTSSNLKVFGGLELDSDFFIRTGRTIQFERDRDDRYKRPAAEMWVSSDKDLVVTSCMGGNVAICYTGDPMAGDDAGTKTVAGFSKDEIRFYCTIKGPVRFENQPTLYSQEYLIVGDNLSSMTIRGLGTSDAYLEIRSDAGSYGVTMWASDIVLKANIAPSPVNALSKILAIEHTSFDWRADGKHQNLGVIANRMQQIEPSWVFGVNQPDGSERLQISSANLIPYITKSIQEVYQDVKSTQTLITDHTGELIRMNTHLSEFEIEIINLKAEVTLLRSILEQKEAIS